MTRPRGQGRSGGRAARSECRRKEAEMDDQLLFWLEDLDARCNDRVGKKCANLGEIASLGLPTPPGFAVSVEGYRRFMTDTGAEAEIRAYLDEHGDALSGIRGLEETSAALRRVFRSRPVPAGLDREIRAHYRELCTRCGAADIRVSVRSAGASSHPGQYETYLNVAGEEAVEEKVRDVWSSTFNARSLAARRKQAVSLHSDPIGVAVLKMVDARSAGVLFTADPNTGDESRMIIEANWGLGESVVGGEVVPDRLILDKQTLSVVDRHLGRKERLVAYGPGGGVVEKEVTPAERGRFCLTDEEAGEVGRLGLALERHFGCPQDVEWAVDAGLVGPRNVVLLQTRPEVMAKRKAPIDQVLDFMTGFASR